ncbi:unnamed protein product [Effrenium voratum]|nr:unnamed protein product [Effrenium voratum]
MMPPSSGAEQALGPPRDDFILRPEVLPWSEQDFLGGLEENQRIVQDCEAQFARLMAQHSEGFRAPEEGAVPRARGPMLLATAGWVAGWLRIGFGWETRMGKNRKGGSRLIIPLLDP